MDEKREYWAFISYRHLDNHESGREWATWIAREIETYEIPPELVGTTGNRGDEIPGKLYPVFRDEDELSADDDLSSPIYEALRNSKTLVVVCSPRAVTSRYVDNEITYFKSLGRSDRVLAMMIEGEPHDPGGRECFPDSLKHPVDETGRLDRDVDIEPVAADFRLFDGSQGWTSLAKCRANLSDKIAVEKYRERCELAKLKLIAGILGVPLGVLVERDKAYQLEQARRRARIFTTVAATMAILAVVAVVAGINAWINAKEAASERDRARQSEEVALQARGTAEKLISQMLFDLGGKLEPIGQLDLLEDVSRSAEEYFESLPADQVDAESERNRGVMLDSRARVLRAAGNLEEAHEHFREALDIAKQLAENEPDNTTLETDVILSLKNVADVLTDQNRTSEAVPLYEEAARRLSLLVERHLDADGSHGLLLALLGELGDEKERQARQLLADNPGIAGLMETSAVLMERLGKVAQIRGNLEAARSHFEGSVEVQRALASFQPDSRQIRESLCSGYNALGNLAISSGDNEAARRNFEKVIELARKELAAAGNDVPWKEKLAAGLERLSYVLSLEGETERYLEMTEETLEIWRSIARDDPGNHVRRRNLFVGLTKSAFAEKTAGNVERALEKFVEAGEIAASLVELDPTNALWRQDLAFNLASQANLQQLAGNQKLCLEKNLEGISHQRIVTEGAPENLAYRRNLLLALNGAATAYWANGETENASRFFTEATEIARSIVDDLPQPTSTSLQDLSNAHMFLGQLAREREDLETAITSFEQALRAARQAYDSGLGWEDLTEENLELARKAIDELKQTPAAP